METTVTKEDVYFKYIIDKDKHIEFDENSALALLFLNEVIFPNDHWWRDDFFEEQKKLFSINMNCNDVFAWGCADAEELLFSELQDLYDHWDKDPYWGPAVWCCKKRKELPQKPAYDSIMARGVWNLGEMNLKPNLYDSSRTN